MKITDSVTLGDARVNDAGYLEANARTARVGVQQYLGPEVGKPELGVVNVFRDEREVFSKRSLDTFSKIPITLDHPPVPVTAETWKDFAVGTTGDDVLRDGEFLKIGLKITDAAAVKAVHEGKRELSVGYSTELVWEDGIAPDGTPYQARQTAIVADHVAIVQRGRAGQQARIGDSAGWGASPVQDHKSINKEQKTMTLKTVTVDGIPIEVTDQGATVIATLQTRLADAEKKLSDANTSHAATLAAKDKELATKDAALDAEKAKVLDATAIDKLVQDRATLVDTARKIAKDVKTDGLSDAEIRKAVVTAKLGDAAVKDKADAYIDARFDILAEDAAKSPADPVRDTLKGGLKVVSTDAAATEDAAYQRYLDGFNRTKKEA